MDLHPVTDWCVRDASYITSSLFLHDRCSAPSLSTPHSDTHTVGRYTPLCISYMHVHTHTHKDLIISGDFNLASATSTLPTLTQYVIRYTGDNKILDLLNANTREVYNPSPLPPVARTPKALLRRQAVAPRNMKGPTSLMRL